MKILTAQQMSEVDRLTTSRCNMPGSLLMENAGIHLYLTLEDYFEDLEAARVLVICGVGNNGGDGFVLARQLLMRDVSCEVFLLGDAKRLQGDAALNHQILAAGGSPPHPLPSLQEWALVRERLDTFDIVVDAILGTGINRPLDPASLFGAVVTDLNTCRAFILSVDIPSGMRSDSLLGGDLTVEADATVTFTAPKIAHILSPDLDRAGDLHIVPIGTPPQLLEENPEHSLNLITARMVAPDIPERRTGSHKGTFGHVAVLAGSVGKSGAASLCAQAALRSGAGLVTALVPQPVQAVVAASAPEIMTEDLPSKEGFVAASALDRVWTLLEGKSAAAMGPGLGTAPETGELVKDLVERSEVPLVIDADALNLLAPRFQAGSIKFRAPLVLTPHPGEFSRLVGLGVGEVLADRVRIAREFAVEHRLWLVLKGFRTLVATPGGEVYACPLGNPGMASAGMGDVLTGVLAALIGMSRPLDDSENVTRAVTLGVFLHSLAGDLAEEEVGAESLSAGEVIDSLSQAYRYLYERMGR